MEENGGSVPTRAGTHPVLPPGLSRPARHDRRGRWQPGHQVPPERELARQYGGSLITVRRALDELARERRLERTRGRGTFVLAPRIDRDLDDPLLFSEEMQLAASIRRLASSRAAGSGRRARRGRPRAGARIADAVRRAAARRRRRSAPARAGPSARRAIPGLLARTSSAPRCTACSATATARSRGLARHRAGSVRTREARLLGLRPRMPALLVEGMAFTTKDSVEFSRTFVRGDRTRYYVERIVVRREAGGATTTARRVAATTTRSLPAMRRPARLQRAVGAQVAANPADSHRSRTQAPQASRRAPKRRRRPSASSRSKRRACGGSSRSHSAQQQRPLATPARTPEPSATPPPTPVIGRAASVAPV